MEVMYLELSGISKWFLANNNKIKVLHEVTLRVEQERFVVLLGPSGCGKTTLLRIAAGLEEADEGMVIDSGNPVTGPDARRAMVLQSYSSFPWLTAYENVEFGLKLKGTREKQRRKITMGYLERVGLVDFKNAYPYQLSGGMRQRVAIARTLASGSEILLLDEPFGALDSETRFAMQELLLELWEEESRLVLFVTHDLEEAIFLADEVHVISPRPASICKSFLIPFTRPRTFELRTSSDFNELKGKMHHELRSIRRGNFRKEA